MTVYKEYMNVKEDGKEGEGADGVENEKPAAEGEKA